ncbi:MAG TPA: 2Fe-2S iron-sulfur cluster-binding protein, partial [Burkholderiales bacterium]|nr:2Fe-2S iron-sulfur cluster-binding protein [Burkholderiales bacterium]
MPFTVTIQPSGHRFSVDDGETVLAAALREGFPLAYGCRDGACGTCKGRVLDGTVDYGHHQESALSQQDKAAGFALFCCARPLSDLAIECREVAAIRDIPVRKLPCRVQKIVKAAPTVLVVSLKLPANERMQFLAGQYLDFLLKDGTRRSFSMANAPHDDELLELHIRNYGGSFSQYAFGTMKERDILRFEGPLGTFFLRDDSAKPIVLVAGGTGFAPIKAIIEHALHHRIPREMVL